MWKVLRLILKVTDYSVCLIDWSALSCLASDTLLSITLGNSELRIKTVGPLLGIVEHSSSVGVPCFHHGASGSASANEREDGHKQEPGCLSCDSENCSQELSLGFHLALFPKLPLPTSIKVSVPICIQSRAMCRGVRPGVAFSLPLNMLYVILKYVLIPSLTDRSSARSPSAMPLYARNWVLRRIFWCIL